MSFALEVVHVGNSAGAADEGHGQVAGQFGPPRGCEILRQGGRHGLARALDEASEADREPGRSRRGEDGVQRCEDGEVEREQQVLRHQRRRHARNSVSGVRAKDEGTVGVLTCESSNRRREKSFGCTALLTASRATRLECRLGRATAYVMACYGSRLSDLLLLRFILHALLSNAPVIANHGRRPLRHAYAAADERKSVCLHGSNGRLPYGSPGRKVLPPPAHFPRGHRRAATPIVSQRRRRVSADSPPCGLFFTSAESCHLASSQSVNLRPDTRLQP